MKIPFIKNKKEDIPETFKKGLLPSAEFLQRGRKNFLAAYDASPFTKSAPHKSSIFALGLKLGVGIMAVIAVVASASAYADTANVSAESPLYPLKRLGETVQLILTPSSQKAQVQANFAVRRANEIMDLQVKNPSSTLIPALTSALGQDISSSLNSASTTKIEGKPLDALCAVFSGLGINLSLHHDLTARFDAQCVGSNIPTSTFNMTPASGTSKIGDHQSSTWPFETSSTISPDTDEHDGHFFHGGGHYFPITVTTTVSSTISVSSTVQEPPIELPKLPF